MQKIFLIISTVLPLIGTITYIYEIFRYNIKPHRITRFIFATLALLTTITLYQQQSQTAIWLSVVTLIQTTIVGIISLFKGVGGTDKESIIAVIIMIFGLFLWHLSRNPLIALIFFLLADFAGVFPTIIKSYHNPFEESYVYWLIDVIASLLNLLAMPQIKLDDIIYSGYLLIANLIVVIIVITGRKNTNHIAK